MKHRWGYALPALALAAQLSAQATSEPVKRVDVRAARAGLAGSGREGRTWATCLRHVG